MTTQPLSEVLLGRIRGEAGLNDDDLFEWLDLLDRLKTPLVSPAPTRLLIRTTTRKLADDGLIVWHDGGWQRPKPKPERRLFE